MRSAGNHDRPNRRDQGGRNSRHTHRAEAERLTASGRAFDGVALLDASIAAIEPAHPLLLDLRRDLVRILVSAGDADRVVIECHSHIPLLRTRLGPDHPAVNQAIAWQDQFAAE